MNVKLITKALHTLSLLSEEDVTTVMNLRALSEDERELLITVLEPQKGTTKRAGKKASKGGSKSSRASGMAAAIKDNLQRREPSVGGFADDVDGLLCQHEFDNGGTCKRTSDHNIHHLQSDTLYHEFDAGKSSTAAQPARGKSSTNGGAGSGTVNSETGKVDVLNVHHAGG